MVGVLSLCRSRWLVEISLLRVDTPIPLVVLNIESELFHHLVVTKCQIVLLDDASNSIPRFLLCNRKSCGAMWQDWPGCAAPSWATLLEGDFNPLDSITIKSPRSMDLMYGAGNRGCPHLSGTGVSRTDESLRNVTCTPHKCVSWLLSGVQ